MRCLLPCVLIASALGAQPDLATQKAQAFARYRALPTLRQLQILHAVEREFRTDPATAPDPAELPEAPAARFFDPRDWGEEGAPPRTLVKEGAPGHQEVRAAFPVLAFLPDLRKGVSYDWGSGTIVRRKRPLTLDERGANLLHGYAPGSDLRLAQALAVLDRDAGMRLANRYFAHCYADLQARVYEHVTLYEAWAAGAALNMPDMDVIAFANWYLKDDSLVAPIPPNLSAPVFERMGQQALEYRKDRTLREAIGAAVIRAEPILDPRYAPLVGRAQYLLAAFGGDLVAIREFLQELPDRDAVVEQVDAEVTRKPAHAAGRDAYVAGLRARADKITQRMLAAIEADR